MHSLTLAALMIAAPAAVAQPAPASIADAAWLAGRWWVRDWAAPSRKSGRRRGGQMAGHSTLARDGKPVFYELMLLHRTAGGLRLRVKHFNPDFTTWEERGPANCFSRV